MEERLVSTLWSRDAESAGWVYAGWRHVVIERMHGWIERLGEKISERSVVTKVKLTVLGRDLALDAVVLEDVRGRVGSVGVGERGHGIVRGGEHGEGTAVDLAGESSLLDRIGELGEAGGSAGVHQVGGTDLHGAAASLGRGLAAHGLEARARGDGLGEGESGHRDECWGCGCDEEAGLILPEITDAAFAL